MGMLFLIIFHHRWSTSAVPCLFHHCVFIYLFIFHSLSSSFIICWSDSLRFPEIPQILRPFLPGLPGEDPRGSSPGVPGSAQGKESDGEVDQRTKALKPGQCAVLVYTSGTTGDPKVRRRWRRIFGDFLVPISPVGWVGYDKLTMGQWFIFYMTMKYHEMIYLFYGTMLFANDKLDEHGE